VHSWFHLIWRSWESAESHGHGSDSQFLALGSEQCGQDKVCAFPEDGMESRNVTASAGNGQSWGKTEGCSRSAPDAGPASPSIVVKARRTWTTHVGPAIEYRVDGDRNCASLACEGDTPSYGLDRARD